MDEMSHIVSIPNITLLPQMSSAMGPIYAPLGTLPGDFTHFRSCKNGPEILLKRNKMGKKTLDKINAIITIVLEYVVVCKHKCIVLYTCF